MSTVSTAFEKAQAEDRAALVGYLPAGFPDKETAIRAALAMCDAGADVIEVGLPYSDPLMDGPVIADAVYHALKGGTRIADVLDTVTAIADAGTAALVMTYWNPVDKYGPDAFARDLASAGGAGLITPDLTPEEAGRIATAAHIRRLVFTHLAIIGPTNMIAPRLVAGARKTFNGEVDVAHDLDTF